MNRPEKSIILQFDQGTIILKNLNRETEPDLCLWDSRIGCWRARGMYYPDILQWLQRRKLPCCDEVTPAKKLRLKLKFDYQLHFYQKEALDHWSQSNHRGSVILPTGSGKSFLALKAIQKLKVPSWIILPTLDLMNQWYDLLTEAFERPIGIIGGGYHQPEDITVTTYDSAYLYADIHGNRFSLIIFDEVHHLPSESYSKIAEMCTAPYRLGLTATYHRLDGLHGKLDKLVGPIVYAKAIEELAGEHLADFEIVRIKVNLTREEKTEYEELERIYNDFIKESGYRFHGPDIEKFLQEVNLKPNARKALLARFRSRKIILNAKHKLDVLESLLKQHFQDRIIIFTENNDLVYKISAEFLVPALTHQTKTVERKQILTKFRRGDYSILVTSKVLNEGVDVPDANIGIILSGSASPKEYLQRLGRVLRKKEGKQAIFYEIVTRGTKEMLTSYRRRKPHAT